MAPISVAIPVAGDHGTPHALSDGGALVDHVHPIAKRHSLLQGRGVLSHGLTLARQGRFLHPERARGEQPGIRADGVALTEHQDVAAYQLLEGTVSSSRREARWTARRYRAESRDRTSALASCVNPRTALITTIAAITTASTGMPSAPSTIHATSEIATAASSR